MTAPTVSRDALILDFAARRPDAVRLPLTSVPTLTPFAARLQRLAAFITEHQLPEVELALIDDSILIEVHDGLVENVVRQWAAALRQPVLEAPSSLPDGTAATMWAASGWDSTGTWWMVTGRAAVPVGACDEPCDGEVHYTGQRDPITNEDVEAGVCPRWAK